MHTSISDAASSALPTDARPEILRMWVAAERAVIKRLVDDDRITVSDTIEAQLCELVQTRTPSRKLSPSDAREAAAELVGPRPLSDYGAWVYYPWSRRLVHVLPEEELVELRTSRNRYLITAAEQAVLATKRVGIVGLSVGQSVAFAIALERGAGELRLADFDTLELSNLNRLRGGLHEIGLPKVLLAAHAIAELDPCLKVTCFPEGLTEANADRFFTDGGKLDLVVDECDGLDMKVRLREKARELRIPVLMQTSDRGMLDIERFDLEPARPLFHGLVGDLRAADLVGLTNEEKVPTLLKLVGAETLSIRAAASMLEVERSIRTWPQLGSAVTLGGGLTADVARRVLLDQLRCSGRFYVDLGALISDSEPTSQVGAGGPPLPQSGEGRGEGRAIPSTLIRKLVTRASLAPSGGNRQPWRWTSTGNRLVLHEDPTQHTELTDFDNLATAVGIGAAAESLVLAAHAEGLGVTLDVEQDDDDGLEVTFDLGATDSAEGHDFDDLAPLLELRRTDRRLGDRSPLATSELAQLIIPVRSAAGTKVTLLTGRPQIEELADLIGQGDRLRILDPGLRREMLAELRWTHEEVEATGDGLDVETLGLTAVDRAGLELCRRSEPLELLAEWDLGSGLTRLGQRWASASSALGLLSVTPADRLGYFRAGRTLQRMWLSATGAGLSLHPLTFLPYAFARLARGEGRGFAAATVRGLNTLRPAYAKLLELDGSEGEALLFRVVRSPTPAPKSMRRCCGQKPRHLPPTAAARVPRPPDRLGAVSDPSERDASLARAD